MRVGGDANGKRWGWEDGDARDLGEATGGGKEARRRVGTESDEGPKRSQLNLHSLT